MDVKTKILEHFAGRWADFYSRLVELPPVHNGNAKIRSPFRTDDRTPSFQIHFDGEFAGRWHDYGTGDHGDAFDFFARLRGIQAFPEVMQTITQEFGLADLAPKKPDGPKPVKTLTERGISEATARAFQIAEGPGNRKVTHQITFPLFDRDGNQIGTKTHKAGQTKGNTAQLYPWKALQHEAVYLVNGEPGVWRCWEAGHLNAICGTGGEGVFKSEWAEHFRGKAVRLTLDNDDTGREGMEKIAKMLHGVAASVELVQWPDDFPAKGDVEDRLNAGHRLEDLAFVPYEPAPSDGASDLSTGPYRIENGRIGYMKTIGRGDDSTEMFSPLCNFTARVADEVIRDDGVETHRVFAVEGVLDDGRPLPRTEVSANQFVNMGWTVSAWGTKARIVAGQSAKDRLREAIQIFSSDVKEHTVYTHTGWRRSGGEWIYLHAGGAIGATSIEVSLESPLDRYCLPDAERFLNVLSGLFASEAVYVERRGVSRLLNEYKPIGNMIGWADEDFYYLLPDATRAAIASALRSAGEHWPHSQNALYRALEKKKALVPGNRESLTLLKEGGKTNRVLKVPRLSLDPKTEPDEER